MTNAISKLSFNHSYLKNTHIEHILGIDEKDESVMYWLWCVSLYDPSTRDRLCRIKVGVHGLMLFVSIIFIGLWYDTLGDCRQYMSRNSKVTQLKQNTHIYIRLGLLVSTLIAHTPTNMYSISIQTCCLDINQYATSCNTARRTIWVLPDR